MSDRELRVSAGENLPALLGGGKRGVNVRPEKIGLRTPMLKPVSKLTRKMSDAGMRLGELYYGLEHWPTIEVVILKVDEIQIHEEKQRGKEMPVVTCASSNGFTPLPDIERPKARSCDECDLRKWSDHPNEMKGDRPKRIPPACKFGFGFFGLIPSLRHAPFWMHAETRDAVKHAKKFLRDYESPECPALNMYELRVEIGTEYHDNGGVEWYVPTFNVLGYRDPEECVEYDSMFQAVGRLRFTPFIGRNDVDDDSSIDVTPGSALPEDDDDIPF